MSNDEFIQYVIKYLAENNNPQKEEVYNHFSEECRRREISENDFYETVLGPASRSIDWDENDTEEMKIVISPDRGTNSTTKQVLDNSSIEKSNPDVDISAYNGQNSPETKKKLSLKAYIQSNNFVFWGFIVLAACIIFFFLIGLGSDKPCTGWDCDGIYTVHNDTSVVINGFPPIHLRKGNMIEVENGMPKRLPDASQIKIK